MSVKKQVAITISFILVTRTSKENFQKVRDLNHIFYVNYLVLFQKHMMKAIIMALIDLQSEVNAMISVFMAKLDFWVQKVDINLQKINDFFWKYTTRWLLPFRFLISLIVCWFSKKTFWIAEITIQIMLNILCWTFYNVDI